MAFFLNQSVWRQGQNHLQNCNMKNTFAVHSSFYWVTNRICGLSLFTDLQKYSLPPPPSLWLHSQYLNFIWLLIIILKHKQSALYLKHLPKTPTCYLSVYQNYINKVVSLNNNLNKKQYFLVHMSQRLRSAFLIKICQLSVVTIELNFYRFYFLLQNHWANSINIGTKHPSVG